ncbi:DNA cytosine methyltransferase [Myxococcus llanfairpwllgwyngyllgogerychwyrndrobwllllantysiliogogogochensis]|uniref:DNA cytosine methyltransferase n=1 Tax=Myxococcus llanfairpwllgwyngyllgogerychwyrndrobwllllantysiliogogogochensis TaxID=2590453 RepID=UPI0024829FD5|nr:DNA cytosine methyltransferase [Myxococcus llanfairpwllgwyngyllgogerychwyrndrobwllllantysiliogogogochensis]
MRAHGLAVHSVGVHPRRALELFAGGGGLAHGLKLAVPSLRTVCYVEREAYAAACLVARMEKEELDSAPVWDDVGTFDGSAWRGVVDCVSGGFPCQDISVAGKGAGLEGERSGLWREYARIVAEVRPRFVFVENVAALRSRGLDRVLADLASLGFDAEWVCLRASDAGAPHKRERLFVLAHTEHGGEFERTRETRREAGQRAAIGGGPERAREGLADAGGVRLEGSEQHWPASSAALRSDSDLPPWPPGRDDLEGWRSVLAKRPDIEPAICRMADGLAHRVDRLRLLGNGVVPQQAALAYGLLHARLFDAALRDPQ